MDNFIKQIVSFENWLGLNTVSINTLKTSWRYFACLGFSVSLYSFRLLRLIIHLYRTDDLDGFIISLECLAFVLTIIAYYNLFVRRKAKLSSLLTLCTAQNQLIEAGISIVPTKPVYIIITAVLIGSAVISEASIIIELLSRPLHFWSVIDYSAYFHYMLMRFTLVIGYVSLKSMINRMHSTVNNVINEYFENKYRYRMEGTPEQNQQDRIEGNSQELMIVKKIKPAIAGAEIEVNRNYFMYALWIVLEMALISPEGLGSIITTKQSIHVETNLIYILMNCLVFFTIVYINNDSSKDQSLREDGLRKYFTTGEEQDQTFLRRQLLSSMHSAQDDGDHVLDLNYPLMMDVAEFGVLIFTSRYPPAGVNR